MDKRMITALEIVNLNRANLPNNMTYTRYANGRSYCGIVFCEKGSAEYVFKNHQRYQHQSGTVALFSETAAYTVRVGPDQGFLHHTVNFSLSEPIFLPNEVCFVPLNEISVLKNLLSSLFYYYSLTTSSAHLSCMSLLYRLLSIVYPSCIGEQMQPTNLARAVSYMATHLNKQISTKLLSELCMMSETSFHRKFKETYGVSPIDYLLRIRTEQAEDFLLHSQLSIAEISLMCGFNDPGYFCRTFKKQTGVTPTKYRIQ